MIILSFTQHIVRACSLFYPHEGYRSVPPLDAATVNRTVFFTDQTEYLEYDTCSILPCIRFFKVTKYIPGIWTYIYTRCVLFSVFFVSPTVIRSLPGICSINEYKILYHVNY